MFNKMFDVITFGSAAQDVHIKSNAFRILDGKICMPFGSKVEVGDIVLSSGGGGTNTAATFAKQGLKVAFCGAIGADPAGLEIVRELRVLRIDTRFLVKKKEKKTNHSIIISNNGEDRTILVYRGASDLMEKNDIPWKKIRARWFYLAPLTGVLCDNFGQLVDFAKKNKIKIAVNPSMQQLALPELKNILQKVDILFLNQEEASFLTKISFGKEAEIFQKIDEICPGIAVMTKGGEGAVASDGQCIYSAKPDAVRKIVDTTGAGDSFAAGFLSGYIKYNKDIVKSVQLGLANSAGNLSEIGAKTGILDKKSDFKRVEVQKYEIS